MDKQEEKLFELLDQKDYDQLNIEEKDFVHQIIGKEIYIKRREVIKTASISFEKENSVIPKPLPVPRDSGRTVFLKKKVPLYYTLAGMAATLLFMIVLTPYIHNAKVIKEEVQIVQHDTVEVVQQVYDTIFQEKEVLVYIEKETNTTANDYVKCQREEQRLLEKGTAKLPPLNIEDLDNKGTSLAGDPSSELIPETEVFNLILKN